MTKRGYCGVALWEPKYIENFGTILRSAQAFGVDFIYLINHRYGNFTADTGKVGRHLPIFHAPDLDHFLTFRPFGAEIVAVEVGATAPLHAYAHPQRAIYLIGGEDRTLPPACEGLPSVRIDTAICLNQAVAASLVLYDRRAKAVRQ